MWKWKKYDRIDLNFGRIVVLLIYKKKGTNSDMTNHIESSFDGVLSIASFHHLYTIKRRKLCLPKHQ